jgi:hypothetical protein
MICVRSNADRSGVRVLSLGGKADITESASPSDQVFLDHRLQQDEITLLQCTRSSSIRVVSPRATD